MKFSETVLRGVQAVEANRIAAGRGFCARAWCQDESAQHSIGADWVQANVRNHQL